MVLLLSICSASNSLWSGGDDECVCLSFSRWSTCCLVCVLKWLMGVVVLVGGNDDSSRMALP